MDQTAENPPSSHSEKRALGVIIAPAGDGKLYGIPLEVAKNYLIDDPHEVLRNRLPDVDVADGRDSVWLEDGTFGVHFDWAEGPYIWHRDFQVYEGPHRHLSVDNQLASVAEG
jgi:hypothetical protein